MKLKYLGLLGLSVFLIAAGCDKASNKANDSQDKMMQQNTMEGKQKDQTQNNGSMMQNTQDDAKMMKTDNIK